MGKKEAGGHHKINAMIFMDQRNGTKSQNQSLISRIKNINISRKIQNQSGRILVGRSLKPSCLFKIVPEVSNGLSCRWVTAYGKWRHVCSIRIVVVFEAPSVPSLS